MIKEYLGVFVVSGISIIYLFLVCNYVINPDDFSDLKLNEKGDLLAGVFSPLAFLWLVYGYLQQGRELKINSESLRLQANELKNSVEEQKKLIKLHEADQKIRFEQAKPHLIFDQLSFNPIKIDESYDPFTDEPQYEPKQQDVRFYLRNLGSPIKNLIFYRCGSEVKMINLLDKHSKEFVIFFLTSKEEQLLFDQSYLDFQFSLTYFDMLGFTHSELYDVKLHDRYEGDEGMYYYKCDIKEVNRSLN